MYRRCTEHWKITRSERPTWIEKSPEPRRLYLLLFNFRCLDGLILCIIFWRFVTQLNISEDLPAYQTFWQLMTWWVRSTFSFKNSYLSCILQGWLRIVELILKWCSLTYRRCIECATTCDNLQWGLCNIFTPLYQYWSSNIYWNDPIKVERCCLLSAGLMIWWQI